ncbi:hypothetical protein Nepgr_008703 [Nepenthes gracilis]|uniref:Uncharacterized protein n=1 Tax=Nepenthes gracilis TaxID=150966 RepID=A0AAD3S9F0_NEPGR|nr:hypothetical protein Nepgr_008703 [Nepenthes gracilis]
MKVSSDCVCVLPTFVAKQNPVMEELTCGTAAQNGAYIMALAPFCCIMETEDFRESIENISPAHGGAAEVKMN